MGVSELLGRKNGDKVVLDLALRSLKNTDETDRAKMVSILMDQNSGPDVVAPICLTSQLRKFEMQSINFVIKRYMTSAIKKTTDEILLNCTSIIYKFMHPVALARNRDDLNERYMSLLMGYPYPFAVREQPRHLRHLSLDVVIPFLKRHIPEFKSYGDAQVKDVANPEKEKGFWATSQEKELKKSKLVQGIFALLTNPEVGQYFVSSRTGDDGAHSPAQLAVSFIEVWYTKWVQGLKNENMSASLTTDIKSFLLEVRYWKEDHAKNALRKQVTYWSEIMNKWEEADCALDSFNAFVRQHSGQLVGNAPLTAEQCELRPKKVLREAVDLEGSPPNEMSRSLPIPPCRGNKTKVFPLSS